MTTNIAEIAASLTEASKRLLIELFNGGRFFAALREPHDFSRDGIVFSERVGIVVHTPSSKVEDRYRVRNAIAGPLYLANPPLVNCADGDSGFRCFTITPAGLALRQHLEQGNSDRRMG